MKDQYDFSDAKRGALIQPSPNQRVITSHVDEAILNWIHQEIDAAGGGSFQETVNQILREHMEALKKTRKEQALLARWLGLWHVNVITSKVSCEDLIAKTHEVLNEG